MAQAWMEAKMQLAKRHGTLVSGCNRATGGVWDDRKKGYVDDRVPGTPKKPARMICTKSVMPTPHGQGRKAKRRALTTPLDRLTFTASSRVSCKK